MKLKSSIILNIFLFMGLYSYAQIDTYDYKSEITGINDLWHKIELPDVLFKDVSSNLSDIRIYGVTKENDIVEAPYILKQNKEERSSIAVDFEIINKSSTNKGVFVTYKVPSDKAINRIKLFFDRDNFDSMVTIEGSQDLKDWFTITEDYRILSIKNKVTSYSFTTVNFPDSKYQYFRVFIKGEAAPKIINAQIVLQEIKEANYKVHAIRSLKTDEQKQKRTTVIDIDLKNMTPVSYLKIGVTNDYDYYRPMRIEYLKDSVKTQKGWKHRYEKLTSGVLNSIESNEFKFRNVIAKKIRVLIANQDSEPLTISSVQAKGYVHELIARFTKPATYYLAYGNPEVSKPSYDLQYLSNKIPDELTKLQLAVSEYNENKRGANVSPLFENEIWLWLIMILIIGLLGGFTLMMIKKK